MADYFWWVGPVCGALAVPFTRAIRAVTFCVVVYQNRDRDGYTLKLDGWSLEVPPRKRRQEPKKGGTAED